MPETTARTTSSLGYDLVVHPLGDDRFQAPNDGTAMTDLPRLFGGQVLAQALVAAAHTVDPVKSPHSLHGYFLRAGDVNTPIDYVVDRVRDGRRLSARSVTAVQAGKPIATVLTSFAQTSGGITHALEAPAAPRPDDLPTLSEAAAAWGGLSPFWGLDGLDVRVDPRRVEPRSDGFASPTDSVDYIWQRVAEPLPDDPLLHRAMLLYMSDVMLLAAALVPHGVALGQDDIEGRPWDGMSLDHAIWFHHPVRADDWLLFAQSSPFAASGRALSRAEVFDLNGRMVASTVQEGLIIDREPAEE